MVLTIQLLILAILVLILVTLFMKEKHTRAARSPVGKMTGYWNGEERRTHTRTETVISAKYSVNTKPSQQKNSTLGKNISYGGMLMQSNEKLLPSTQLYIDIFLYESDRPVTAKGEVVWVKELEGADESGRRIFDIGIRFISMGPKDQERLDRHINNLGGRTTHGQAS